jgi:hypothetical protein
MVVLLRTNPRLLLMRTPIRHDRHDPKLVDWLRGNFLFGRKI